MRDSSVASDDEAAKEYDDEGVDDAEVAAKEYDDEGADDAQDVADDEEVLDKYRKIISLPELCERWD